MSTRFIIIPYDPAIYRDPDIVPPPEAHTDLRINMVDFMVHLRQQWNDAVFLPDTGWQITPSDQLGVGGSFIDDGRQILALELGAELNEFVMWYRSYVPVNYPLYLFVMGMWDSLLLTSATTLEDIANFTGL